MKTKFLARALGLYWRDHCKYALFLLLCLGVFSLMCYLLGLPLAGVWYASLLCLCFGFVAFLADSASWLHRYAELTHLLSAPMTDGNALPTTGGSLELIYKKLLLQSLAEQARIEASALRAQQTKSDYYSLWAHQIKVPIAAMRLLIGAEPSAQTAALGAELFKIEQYVEMALNYMRLNGPSTDYVLKPFPLDSIIRQAVRKFAPLFIQKKLKLSFRETGITVLTDEKWLGFVLEQLLSNAVKYTRSGSVSIYADAAGEALVLEDTGIGVAPEDLPRVFEHGYTGYNGRGDLRATGLGLYLSKQVLAKLGHSISISSTVGQGTRVEIDLSHKEMKYE